MNSPSSLESALKQAIDVYLNDLIEEETKSASDRIKAKLVARISEMAPQVLRRISFPGSGEIIISIRQ